MAENFTKFTLDAKPQVKEARRTPIRISTKISTPGYILFKLQKTEDKEKILKEARGGKKPKHLTC